MTNKVKFPRIFYRSLMNLSIKKLSFVLIATAVLLGGCSKKPKRPDPSSTVLGPDGLSGSNIGGLDGGMVSDPNSGLSTRTPGDYSNVDRATLAAQTVYFDFDQSGIKPSERTKLDAVKAYIDSNPGVTLLLEGHCDWKGTPEYNLGLGDRRANAVKQYLTTSGVAAEKLEVLSKGDLDAVEGADEATTAKDRRVEIGVLK
jgi:peptidoglycan-associated lipoprotein